MTEGALERVLRRDRLVVIAALVIVTGLAWTYILWLAANPTMPGMTMAPIAPATDMSDMAGMSMSDMSAMAAPKLRVWTGAEFAFMFAMWSVMMIGMMTPSAAPMILLYARVGRQAAIDGRPLAASAWFVTGYLLIWLAFSAVATAVQFGLEKLAALTPGMELASPLIGGVVLIVIGIYQWTPLKNICLAHCQSPLSFIQHHGGFKSDPLGSLKLGIEHGAYCVGCCWALMALLFVGGIMNVLWIAGIAILVLVEKITPFGRLAARAAGIVAAVAGAWLVFSHLR